MEKSCPEVCRVCLCVITRVYLQWQEGSSGVDQVNARQAVLNGDFLCSQLLLHCDWIRCAALHRGIIGNENTPEAVYSANT